MFFSEGQKTVYAELKEEMHLYGCCVLILGKVLRDETVYVVKDGYLQKLHRKYF